MSILQNTFIILISSFLCTLLNGCRTNAPDYGNSYALLPENASLIIRTKDVGVLYDKLQQTELWKDSHLSKSTFGASLKNLKDLTETIFPKSTLGDQNDLLISFQRSGLTTANFSIITDISIWGKKFFIDRLRATEKISTSTYDNQAIYEVLFSDRRTKHSFFFFLSSHFIFGSPSKLLVEERIRKLQSLQSISNHSGFLSALKISGRKDLANIFINPRELSTLSDVYFKTDIFPTQLSNWIAIDCNIENEKLILNGGLVSEAGDRTIVKALSEIPFSKVSLIHRVPASSALAVSLALSKTYGKKMQAYRSKSIPIKDQLRLDSIFGFLDREMCFFSDPPTKGDDPVKKKYLMLGIQDRSWAHKSLEKVSKLGVQTEVEKQKVYQIQKKDLIPNYFGNFFSDFPTPYYTIFEDFILMGNDIENLRETIRKITEEKTIQKKTIVEKTKSILGSNYNILVYINHLYTPDFLSQWLKEPPSKKNQQILRKMGNHMVHVRFDKSGGGFLNVVRSADKNPSINLRLKWSLSLKSSSATAPSLFVNHYTQKSEIVLQDQNHNVYLIDQNGKMLWNRNVGSTVKGSISKVDLLKNKKFQMVFNTKKQIHCLDRKGRNVPPFPITLPQYATSPLSIFDYDGKKNYRFFIVLSNRVIVYNSKGKIIKGFKYTKAPNLINKALQHFRLQGTDYILLSDVNGRVTVVNRRGGRKFQTNLKSKKFSPNPWYLDHKKNGWVTSDNYGNLVHLSIKGKLSMKETGSKHENIFLKTTKGYVFIDRENIRILNRNKNVSTTTPVHATPYQGKTFRFGGSEYISFIDLEKKMAHLFNKKGEPVQGFPTKSETLPLFMIVGKKLNMITTVGNNISNYEIITPRATEKL